MLKKLRPKQGFPLVGEEVIPTYHSLGQGEEFTFIGVTKPFSAWTDLSDGALWCYNLNYMDYLNQPGSTLEEGRLWLDNFIQNIESNSIGLDPYPTALRLINWVKFLSRHAKSLEGSEDKKRWDAYLYLQARILWRNLEYHLMGNHLLEDLYALFIVSLYFRDERWLNRSGRLLLSQLEEQILLDGMHYEQSPMYHCILLGRLLDCYNYSRHNSISATQCQLDEALQDYSQRMLGHLESLIYRDKSIPLLGDTAEGIAPLPEELFAYAHRLGLSWRAIPLGVSGYRKMTREHVECVLDIGAVQANYQPGHTQADTFTYELRTNGQPYITDTGISTYNKNDRRLYERSTRAHNTVTWGTNDSSEVWSGFRLGARAKVSIHQDDTNVIAASHDGYKKKHYRSFTLDDTGLTIIDRVAWGSATNWIHFASDIQVLSHSTHRVETSRGVIHLDGAETVELTQEYAARSYNHLEPIQVLKIKFNNQMSYRIEV